ncbi:uncharacterized protein SPSK_02822 [Sporothrix schenckii 1099-18]|uniref:Uncharacterized protein n=1 Tax=Sporothrix schenckii 1099-18 TaxID=1397361 RepID=A0A0F2MAB4_SPOSC|nr:uncharacterized protein SPSK_02822 [Sporothrix schenckii 1099-18]KJR86638.1 hypothetical protein SPSK_02822 [Sporothrix schenckii 1099-18]
MDGEGLSLDKLAKGQCYHGWHRKSVSRLTPRRADSAVGRANRPRKAVHSGTRPVSDEAGLLWHFVNDEQLIGKVSAPPVHDGLPFLHTFIISKIVHGKTPRSFPIPPAVDCLALLDRRPLVGSRPGNDCNVESWVLTAPC